MHVNVHLSDCGLHHTFLLSAKAQQGTLSSSFLPLVLGHMGIRSTSKGTKVSNPTPAIPGVETHRCTSHDVLCAESTHGFEIPVHLIEGGGEMGCFHTHILFDLLVQP